jgi:2Fe-2S ferredoxin
MPTITFIPSKKTVDVEKGTTLFDAAVKAGLPVASSCSAAFICGKCNLQVIEGGDQLSRQTNSEKSVLRRDKNPETDRISCVTKAYGDCTITARYW